jgi:short-subunit dehydrogenase
MKNVLIIGGSSGIGRKLAEAYAAQESMVVVTGRRLEKLAQLAVLSPRIQIAEMDICQTDNLPRQLDALAASMDHLDLVILSAGTGDLNIALDLTIEMRTISTNVSGFTAVVTWAYGYFEKQGYGHLAAITSIAGLRGSRGGPAYNASKAFQINYLQGLRQKAGHARVPIHITEIRPGFVDTDMAKGEGTFWMASVEKASNQIIAGLKAKRSVVYITQRWRLIGWILKILPEFVYKRL